MRTWGQKPMLILKHMVTCFLFHNLEFQIAVKQHDTFKDRKNKTGVDPNITEYLAPCLLSSTKSQFWLTSIYNERYFVCHAQAITYLESLLMYRDNFCVLTWQKCNFQKTPLTPPPTTTPHFQKKNSAQIVWWSNDQSYHGRLVWDH